MDSVSADGGAIFVVVDEIVVAESLFVNAIDERMNVPKRMNDDEEKDTDRYL